MTTIRNPLHRLKRAFELSYTVEESNTEPIERP